MNYYNEFDNFTADWLENLIAAGLIPAGIVDRRSIKEVQPDDLEGYHQAHFFCGIAGWPEALRLAGWTGPCWTGSCPCQPFSAAGKRKGTADERHLWPDFHRLISVCRPPVVFGEQVGGTLGNQWLAGVYADLEAEGYRVPKDENGDYEAYDLPAAGVGKAHIRQRLFWVADTGPSPPRHDAPRQCAEACFSEANRPQSITSELGRCGSDCDRLGDTSSTRLQERIGDGRTESSSTGAIARQAFELASCRDGKARRFEPGSFPLAHGIPRRLGQSKSELASLARPASRNRVGRLRGYGNAIVPEVAAEFIRAFMEVQDLSRKAPA